VANELQTLAEKEGLKSSEQIKNVRIAQEDWTIENQMMTATEKPNRTKLEEKYKKDIEEMYSELPRS